MHAMHTLSSAMVMLKKLEQLFSPKRNFISGFFLGIGVSLIVLFVSNSLKGSSLTPTVEEQGFYNVCVNSSFVSTTAHTVAPELQGSSGESNDSVIAGVDEKFVEGNENGTRVFMTAQWGKITEEDEDRSFWVEQESVRQKDGNFDSDGDGGTAQSGNSSEIFRFERLHGEGGRAMENSSVFGKEERIEAKFSNNSSNGDGMVTKDENNEISGFESQTWEMQSDEDSDRKCDIYDGQWVRDDSVPYYPAGSCPHVDMQFNCHLNRRPDDEFLKWKWQPYGCEIPRLRPKATALAALVKGRPCVDLVVSPFLVRESSFAGKNGSFQTLRLDLMDQSTSKYRDADIIVFNTAHWWNYWKTARGLYYYQEGNYVHPRLKVLEAYKRALATWARWVDKNINPNRTRVFFRGYAYSHYSNGQWNSGGDCHKETEPIFNEAHLSKYPSKMRAVEYTLQEMKTPVMYLNISRLTDYRKDAHPSIYRREYKTKEEEIAAERSQDCNHYCLPGVPDTWNELLYASLLKDGWGAREK